MGFRPLPERLDRFRSNHVAIDLVCLSHRQDEDLPIADGALRARASCCDNRLNRALNKIVIDGYLQGYLP